MSTLPDMGDIVGRVWTEADLDDLPEQYRYEIVDGRLLVSPRPAINHARAAMRVRDALARVLPAELEVLPEIYATLPNSSRIPDLVVVPRTLAGDALSLRPSDMVLAIEVESPSSVGEDRIRKPAEYAAAGIAAYWQVTWDELPLITAHALNPGSRVYRTLSGPSPRAENPFVVDLAG